MCFWFRRKSDIEPELDPRVGAKNITAPVPGGFADPATAPTVFTTSFPAPQTIEEPAPPTQPTIVDSEPTPATNEKADHSSLLRRLTSTSHKSSGIPAQSPPHSPPLPQPGNARPQSSSSTQLSGYSGQSYPNSPQPSPKWTKVSSHGHGRSQSSDPGERHNSQSGMSQKSRSVSPDPIPVHAAYIPSDQLSIGAKLSPGLTSSISTTPTTMGPRTGSASYSQTISHISVHNPWKRDSSGTMPRNITPSYSNAVSPVEGRLPFGRDSEGDSHSPKHLPMGFTMQSSQHSPPMLPEMQQHTLNTTTPPQTPPWERKSLPKIVTVATINGQPVDAAKEQDTEKEKRERHRLSLHMPSLKSRKKKGPMSASVTAQEKEKSPTSAESVEQWPGKF